MRLIELLEVIADTAAKNEVITRKDLGYDYTYFYNTLLLYLLKSIAREVDITNVVTREYYDLYELSEKDIQDEVPKLYYCYYLNSGCGEYIIKGFKTYKEADKFLKNHDGEYITMIVYECELVKVSVESINKI